MRRMAKQHKTLLVLTALITFVFCSSSALAEPGTEPLPTRLDASPEKLEALSTEQWSALRGGIVQAKLRPSPGGVGGPEGEYGYSVSLDGNRALVGAIELTGAGAVVVLEDNGNGWEEVAVLLAADGANNDRFGWSVSLDGDRALVGAVGDADNGTFTGAAYVFDFDGASWSQTQKLTALDAAGGDSFGRSVSVDGNRALIGASGDDDNGTDSGSAYVFDFDGTNWSQTAKLLSLDGEASDQFAEAVALLGDRALIGAVGSDNGAITNAGAAYVFDFNGADWIQTQKLTASDGVQFDQLGNSVSLSGDRALVGASNTDDNGFSSGSAYVFDFDGASWSETTKLLPDDGTSTDQFGRSVSLSGDRALVGADGANDFSGAAYVFDFNGTWSQSDKISGVASARFGWSVSLSADQAMVGDPSDVFNGVVVGSVTVFDFNGVSWDETLELIAEEGAGGDEFGRSVSLAGDRAAVGAARDGNNGLDSGSAYVFDFNGTIWNETAKLLPLDGAAGDYFGEAVSLSGNRLLVGASFGNGGTGAAYVFDFDGSTWVETARLAASDGMADDLFGIAVSLQGDRALIGASNDDVGTGSAYVFDFDGAVWTETDKLTASDGAANDRFGAAVALSGNRVLIGARNDDSDRGSAYVFEFDGIDSWTEDQKLTASDRAPADRFGTSVDLLDDQALIGAAGDDSGRGSAYRFGIVGSSWTQVQKFTASDREIDASFGTSVSMAGDQALIGAPNDGLGGATYLFSLASLAEPELNKLTAADTGAGDRYGFSVMLSGGRALIGAPSDDEFNGQDSGSAYVVTDLQVLFSDRFEGRP